MDKIRVCPVAVGPNSFIHAELHTAFYPLGCLSAYAKIYEGGSLNEAFDFERITPFEVRAKTEVLDGLPNLPGIFLLSCYVWNFEANMEIAAEVKRRWPSALVLVGGPHVPRNAETCREFFAAHPCVDVTVRNEGERTLAEVLEVVARDRVSPDDLAGVDLSGVAGLSFKKNGDVVRTSDRGRIMDLGVYPSPYASGEFDHWFQGLSYMPFETNRGCPYGCTFCDWGSATLSKIARMTQERIFSDIEFGSRRKTRMLGICDANFGILPRDVETARFIVQMRERYGFPQTLGFSNAKVATPRLTEIVKLLSGAGLIVSGQISMQTTDEQVLENVKRANIKTSEYQAMIAFFHREDIPTVSDMMLGLPGQNMETCKNDLQFMFDHKVLALVFATSVMPNAPMADEEYRNRFKIVVGADGMVESTYSFDRDEYARMFELCLAYKLFVKQGLLKYLLYYAQVEHGVLAIDFIAKWLELVRDQPDLYPLGHRLKTTLLDREYTGGGKDWLVLAWGHEQARFLFDSPEVFYREVLRCIEREFGVRLEGSGVDAILTANAAVLPRMGQSLPAEVPVSHDVVGYFSALRALRDIRQLPLDVKPLREWGPAEVTLRPGTPRGGYQFADLELTFGTLEVASNLRI